MEMNGAAPCDFRKSRADLNQMFDQIPGNLLLETTVNGNLDHAD